MKIQCDACNKQQASLFCTADEAALCEGCDPRVHHANKLASKHERFSLEYPCSEQHPLCDVCQEKRAFVFCQQDRAIVCQECDFGIHSANEHTKKHSRFLLSGTKLSAAAAAAATLYSSSSPSSNSKSNLMGGGSLVTNEEGVGFTSSISQYLMETIPGWQVEDFLDPPSSKNNIGDDNTLALFDANGNLCPFSPETWIPQAPSSLQLDQKITGYTNTKEATKVKTSRTRLEEDNNFIVPQMSPVTNIASKRPRILR